MGKTEDSEEAARRMRQHKAIFVLHPIVIDQEGDQHDDAERQEGEKDVDPVEREQSSTHRAQTCHDPALEEPRAIGERGGCPGQEHKCLRCIRQAEVAVGHMRERAVRHVVGEDRQ